MLPGACQRAGARLRLRLCAQHGLYWLFNNLAAERPLALSVDDLHWSDAESLRFFAYLAPRLDGLPLAALASMRPEGRDTGELARLAAALILTGAAAALYLRGDTRNVLPWISAAFILYLIAGCHHPGR